MAVVALCIVTNGCRLELAVELIVDRDGGGEVVLALSADAEAREAAAAAGIDPLADLVAEVDALPGWEASGGEGAAELRRPFADAAELAEVNRELVAALDLPEGRLLDELVVAMDEEQRLLIASTGLGLDPTEQAAADLGMTREELLAAMEGTVAATLTVSLPAEVIEAAASAADGQAAPVDVTGEPDGPQQASVTVAPGERRRLQVVGEQPGLDPLVVPLAAAAGIALLATVALFLRRPR